jgi:hypothetical protein
MPTKSQLMQGRKSHSKYFYKPKAGFVSTNCIDILYKQESLTQSITHAQKLIFRQLKMLNDKMTAQSEGFTKREKIQQHFWNIVGSVEHINVPKLEDAIKKEFNTDDNRLIQAQVKLMQTEARIKVQNKVKVWIKQPTPKKGEP